MPIFTSVSQKSASAPTSIDEVNCFAVMVTGPEPFMNRTSCPVIDGNSTTMSTKTVGAIRGMVPAGGVLSLPVAAGIKRQFTLVGFKASPAIACMDFNSPFLSFDFISQPFVLGESASIDLPPGAEVNVPIKIPPVGTTFSISSPRIGDCSGPDSPTDRNRITPTQIRVTKNYFPLGNLPFNGCHRVDLEFVDDLGRNGLTHSSFNLTIAKKELPLGTSFVSSGFYADSGCQSILASTFTVPVFTRNYPVYVSTVASPGIVSSFQFQVNSPDSSSPYADMTSGVFPLRNTTSYTVDISGPRRLVKDMCYDMKAYFLKANKTAYVGDGFYPHVPNIEGKIFSGMNCTSTALTNGSLQTLPIADLSFDFSVRYSQDFYTQTYFSITPTTSMTTDTFGISYPIQVVGGSYNPTFLRPEVDEQMPSTAGCYGPYQVLIENERGGALVTSGTISLSFLSGSPPQVGVFNNSACNQTYASVVNDDYRRVFYIKVASNISVSQTATLRASGQIVHPSTLGTTTQQVVSLTTFRNISF